MKKLFMAFLISLVGLTTSAVAHEPLFGLGPHAVGQYAWAVESELEREHEGWANHYELAYGVTPDIVVTAAFPYIFADDERKAGFGDLVLRGKYRFFRRDVLNASNAFAFHWGIKFPTGSRKEHRGTGTTDYFVGLSFGHEARKNYAFADVRYQINGSVENIDRGNVLNLDAAFGIRPWQLEYLQPDLVLLVEMLGEFTGKNAIEGIHDPNSGGSTFSVAPGFLFSYRNIMLKGGVKFTLLERLNGVQESPGTEFLFAVELHMPPFK